MIAAQILNQLFILTAYNICINIVFTANDMVESKPITALQFLLEESINIAN